MARQIHLTDPVTGLGYTLEFDRDSVVYAESIGFSIAKVRDAVATDMITLFRAAFHKHHPAIGKDDAYAIWDRIPSKQELFELLMDMFQEPFNALIEEPSEGDSKNVSWVVAQ